MCQCEKASGPRRQWVLLADGGYRLSGEAWSLAPNRATSGHRKRYPWLLTDPAGKVSEIGPEDVTEALCRAEFAIEAGPLIRLP